MDEPRSSLDLHELVEHTPAAIADSLLSFPGTRLLHPAERSWWDWKARWESGERYIEIDVTLFDNEEQHWGGSSLDANCSVEDLLTLWRVLQSRHSGIWLHDPDCEMHTPESFLANLAGYRS